MAVNKVVLGEDTLIDLTADTVSADKLSKGVTAHDMAGEPIVGTMEAGGGKEYTFTDGLTETNGTVKWDLNDRLSGGKDGWNVNKLVFNGNTFEFGLPNSLANTPAHLRSNYTTSSGERIFLSTSRTNLQACQVVLNAPNSGNPSFYPHNFGSNKLDLGKSGNEWNNGYFAGDILANNIPAPPSADGEYNLHCSIVNGVPTYTWKAEQQ